MLADQAKAEHKLKYPQYTYKPRKSSEKKRRMTKKKAAALAESNQATANTMSTTTQLPEQQFEPNNTASQGSTDHIEDAKLFAQALTQDYHPFLQGGDLSYFANTTAEYEEQQYQPEESEFNVDNFLSSFFGWN
jgi:hypothetical protein